MPRAWTKGQCVKEIAQHLGEDDEIGLGDIEDEINNLTKFIEERVAGNPRLTTLRYCNDNYLLQELKAIKDLETPSAIRQKLRLSDGVWQELYRTACDLVKIRRRKKDEKKKREKPLEAPGPSGPKRPRTGPYRGILIHREARICCQVGNDKETRVSCMAGTLTDHLVDDDYVHTRDISMDRWIEQIMSTEQMRDVDRDTLRSQTRNGMQSITSEGIFHAVIEESIIDGVNYNSATNIGWLARPAQLLFTMQKRDTLHKEMETLTTSDPGNNDGGEAGGGKESTSQPQGDKGSSREPTDTNPPESTVPPEDPMHIDGPGGNEESKSQPPEDTSRNTTTAAPKPSESTAPPANPSHVNEPHRSKTPTSQPPIDHGGNTTAAAPKPSESTVPPANPSHIVGPGGDKVSTSQPRGDKEALQDDVGDNGDYIYIDDDSDDEELEDIEDIEEDHAENDENDDGLEDNDDEETSPEIRKLRAQTDLDRMTRENYQELCLFLKVSEAQLADADTCYSIPGLRVGLRPYQVLGALEMLKQENSAVHGGFLGDRVGFGKTCTVYTYLVFRCWIAANMASVRNEWADENPGKRDHLPRGAKDGACCPSAELWPIQCVCTPRSIIRRFRSMRGATLILTPKGLLENWVYEWLKFIDVDKLPEDTRPKLVSGHTNIKRNYTAEYDDKIYSVEIPTMQEVMEDRHFQATNMDKLVTAWKTTVQAVMDKTDHPLWPDAKPSPCLHQLVILTTSGSYGSRVNQAFTKKWHTQVRRGASGTVHRESYMGEIGSVIVDECHKEKSTTSNQIRILCTLGQQLPRRPYIWALSATFVQTGPQDMAGYCAAFRGDAAPGYNGRCKKWDQDESLQWYNSEVFMNLNKTFKTYMDAKGSGRLHEGHRANYDETVKTLRHFMKMVVIMRHEKCMWPDRMTASILDVPRKPCKSMPEIIIEDVEGDPQLDDVLKNRVAKIEAAVAGDIKEALEKQTNKSKATVLKFSKHGQRARISGSLPFVTLYDDLALTQEDMKSVMASGKHEKRLISEVVRKHTASCWKFTWLSETIRTRLGVSPVPQHNGGRRKMILVAQFPCVAMAFYEYVRQKHPDTYPIHVDATTPNRTLIIREFNDEEKYDDRSKQLILISTAQVIGTGYNLPRASTMVIVEPLDRHTDEIQVGGRILRSGQLDPDAKVYALRTKGSYVDDNILIRHHVRESLVSDATSSS